MGQGVKETYSIRIERPGMGDVDDLARTADPQIAAALVQTLLQCRDDRIARIIVQIARTVIQEKAV